MTLGNTTQPAPTASLQVREHGDRLFYEAVFRHGGRQVKRRVGPAWIEDGPDGWQRRRGRVPEGYFDERRAHVAAAGIVGECLAEAEHREQIERERATAGATFREIAHDYMRWLEDVRGAKRSSLRDRESVLAEPGTPYRRGEGKLGGHVLAALGDRPASKVTTREVSKLLEKVSASGASASTVNKYRATIVSIFNYGMRESTYGLPTNPALATDKRRVPDRAPLVFYSPEEIEALSHSLAEGNHRALAEERHQENPERSPAEVAEDAQDAALVRVAAYAGLRLGELLALRWGDIDFAGHALTISRAISSGVESSTKSGRLRRVPLPDQAAAALDRLSQRGDYTSAEDRVFCNVFGRTLDGSALRRCFKKARDAVGLRALRFHDLRHTYGSLLAAGGVDLVTIQAAMGHSALATTGRYLHARPASEQAALFTRVFQTAGTELRTIDVER
jgi:integrase